MIGQRRGELISVPFADATNHRREVDYEGVELIRILSI
jgi:hypothetical protein